MGLEINDGLRAGDRAVAKRWVFAISDHLAGNFGGVHMRHDDTLGAAIKHAGGMEMLKARHPNDRGNSR